MKRKLLILLAVAAMALCLSAQAMAYTSILNLPNYTSPSEPQLSEAPGPYAELQITVSGKVATVTVTADKVTIDSVEHQYLLGDVIGLNLSQAATADNFSYVLPTGNTAPTATQGSSPPTVDGWGYFNTLLNFGSAAGNRFISVTFDLTADNNWASDSMVLTLNSEGYQDAAHIFTDITSPTTGQDITGFAAQVPLPSTLLLLGAGMVRLAAYGRKKKQTAA
ncbi:MAG: hypothetical protein P8168_02200 [Deltaproteobacteria bacterium]